MVPKKKYNMRNHTIQEKLLWLLLEPPQPMLVAPAAKLEAMPFTISIALPTFQVQATVAPAEVPGATKDTGVAGRKSVSEILK
jgi:hypothetical protein